MPTIFFCLFSKNKISNFNLYKSDFLVVTMCDFLKNFLIACMNQNKISNKIRLLS